MNLPTNPLSYDNVSEVATVEHWLRGFLKLLGIHLRQSGVSALETHAKQVDELSAHANPLNYLEKWIFEALEVIWQLVRPGLLRKNEPAATDKKLHSLILIDFMLALISGFFVDDIENKVFFTASTIRTTQIGWPSTVHPK